MNIREFKRELARTDTSVTLVFKLAVMLLSLLAQLVVFVTLFTMIVFFLASSDMPVAERRALGAAIFVFTVLVTSATGYLWMRSLMLLSENKRRKRKHNGQWESVEKLKKTEQLRAAEVTANGGKRKEWLIDGQLYDKDTLDSILEELGGGVGGQHD